MKMLICFILCCFITVSCKSTICECTYDVYQSGNKIDTIKEVAVFECITSYTTIGGTYYTLKEFKCK